MSIAEKINPKSVEEYYLVDADPIKVMEEIRGNRQEIIEAQKIKSKTEREVSLFCEEELLYQNEFEELTGRLGIPLVYNVADYKRINLFDEKGTAFIFSYNRGGGYRLEMMGGSLKNKNPQFRIAELYLNYKASPEHYSPAVTIANSSLQDIITSAYMQCEKNLKKFLEEIGFGRK